MKLLYQMAYVILDIFSLYCIGLFFNCFLGQRRQGRRYLYYMLAFLLYTAPNILFGIPLLNLFCSVLTCMLLAVGYEGLFKYKVVLSCFAVILGMITELSGTLLVHVVDGVDTELYALVVSTMAKLSYLVVIKILNQIGRRKKEKLYTAYYWWLILLVPISSIYAIYQNYIWIMAEPEIINFWQILIYIYLFLFVNVLVFFLYDKFLEMYENALSMEQIRVQNKCYVGYLEAERKNNERLRKWKHDMKNYLFGILALLEAGDYETARERLARQAGDMLAVDSSHFSGNPVIDSILSYKLGQARERGIQVEYSIKVPSSLNISADDLAVVLGNSLDNAMEACSKLEADRRFIRLVLHYDRGALIYRMENPYQHLRRKGDAFLSTKHGAGEEHGIGLRSMRSVAERYQGWMEIQAENMVFKLHMLFFAN